MVGQVVRKQLWGRAGERCALCNLRLTQADGTDSIVGDEAHIRSPKDKGPRYNADYPPEKLDSYENLLLLCKVHHKLVDDNPGVFTVELLEMVKRAHVARVANAIDSQSQRRTNWVRAPTMELLDNGTEVTRTVMNAQAFMFDHDHPETDAEADAIAGFLQNARDWGEISDVIEQSGRVSAAMGLHDQLMELNSAGFIVLGGRGTYQHGSGMVFDTAVLHVMRQPGAAT